MWIGHTNPDGAQQSLRSLLSENMVQLMLWFSALALVASAHCDAQFHLPIDCDDIHRHDNTTRSGVYTIYPGGPTTPLHVYCDMDTDGGRWTVFHKRVDGTENFYRPWKHYKSGFGNVAGEYWLGLDNIFLLTMRKKNELRVDMEDWQGEKASAKYLSFSIESENAGYQLHLGSFTGGNAGDSLSGHNSMRFTTFDKDMDIWDRNCAQRALGGFWYKNCHAANPTGLYAPHNPTEFQNVNVIWNTWKGYDNSLKTIVMKMRPVNKCSCTD